MGISVHFKSKCRQIKKQADTWKMTLETSKLDKQLLEENEGTMEYLEKYDLICKKYPDIDMESLPDICPKPPIFIKY